MRRTAALALALLLAAPPVARAAGPVLIEGVEFAASRSVAGADLVLHRAALLRWKYLFDVYVAALYLAPGVRPERVLADTPKRLEIQYFYGFSAEDFVRSTHAGIAANVAPAALEALRERIDALGRLYLPVEPGDRYALSYVPGAGTELALNGRVLGRVDGADFAAAVFSIWLGPSPIDETLKRDLLGPS
jgi:hypothetical protein